MLFTRITVVWVSLLLAGPVVPQEQPVSDAMPPAGEAAPAAAISAEQPAAPLPKDIVLVLDNSGSMKKSDPQLLMPVAVTDFINRLDADSRLAIIIFDKDVRMPVPLTPVSDGTREQILQSLGLLDYKGLLTASPDAVERAIYELKTGARPEAQKLIVFMTDGIVDTGNAAADIERTKWLREDLAPDAADSGIRIFGIAFTEAADFQLTQSLAQHTDGEYFRALSADALAGVFERINAIIDRPPPAPALPEPVAAMPPPPAPEPIVIEVPAAIPESVQREAQMRSMIVMVSAVVIIGLLVWIIIALIRRSRDLSVAGEQYVAEAYLKDLGGNTKEPMHRLGSRPTMLGRVAGKESELLDYIVIPQSTIGRRHAMIEYKDFGYWIMDQGSINGTFVNDRPVTSEVRLKHGDRVRLHRIEFEFVMPEMSEAGMTVVSHTTYAGKGAAAAEESTVLKAGGSPARKEEEVFDLENLEAGAVAGDEEDTVVRGNAQPRPAVPAPESDDETLLPGSESAEPAGAAFAAPEDETLMPGSGGGSAASFDPEDETVLPGSAEGDEKDKAKHGDSGAAGDEFFDITGAGKPPS
jgi:uncharacterized protein YegL